MAKRLTPEVKAQREADHKADVLARRIARKAETAKRNEAKREAIKAQRQAEWDARNAQWKNEREQRAIDFRKNTPKEDLDDLEEALKNVEDEQSADFSPTFMQSIKRQYATSGYLSAAQMAPVLKKFRADREREQQAITWPVLKEGDKVSLRCTITRVEAERVRYGYHSSMAYHIWMKSHYGRAFKISTGKEDWYQIAQERRVSGQKVFARATVKWIAPNPGGTVVLSARSAVFGDLL